MKDRENSERKITLKKEAVDPPLKAPYLILVCLAKSSALSIGESIRSTVRKAARLAVYEEIMIKVKNHHIPATILVETALEGRTDGTKINRTRFEFRKRKGKESEEDKVLGPLLGTIYHLDFMPLGGKMPEKLTLGRCQSLVALATRR